MRGPGRQIGRGVVLAAASALLSLMVEAAITHPPTAQAAPRPVKAPPALHFAACPSDAGVDTTTGCARIRVPLDYARPGGQKISLMVAANAAAGAPSRRQGVLFVNPGGPGVSALWLASAVWNALPPDLQAAYEVVAVDPRGVGHSTPVSCHLRQLYAPPLPNVVPADRRTEQRYVHRARTTAQACARRYSRTFLAHIDTVDMARDLDAVRAALRVPKINFLGYSYGTYLGEVYGQLFPHRVRRMILDSVVDPSITGYQAAFRQDAAFQVRLREFFSWVARRHGTYHLGSSVTGVARRWHEIRRRLGLRPVAGRVGPSELDEATVEALYSTTSWSGLAQALADYQGGSDQQLALEGKILNGASNASTLAVICRDTPWPRQWATWDRDTRRAFRSAPLTAWENTWENAPCAFWPVRGRPVLSVTGTDVPPVLLLQSRRDPATPVAGALHVRALYGPHSRIVLEAGGNHGQYLFNQNPCMDRYGNAYLLSGRLPGPGSSCRAPKRYAAPRRSVRAI